MAKVNDSDSKTPKKFKPPSAIAEGIGLLYLLIGVWTFVFQTFFEGFRYNWWNWIIKLPSNWVTGLLWPGYWLVRWIWP